jgi:hypothetical protein
MTYKKVIVTTTINHPTEALIKYSLMQDWKLIIVGDLKTPHKEFLKMKDVIYLSPKDQERISKSISDIIGWNSIQRRNFGFLYAKKIGAEIIATVDDDNIPLKNWGKSLFINKIVRARIYKDKIDFFDPISITEHKHLWHRGFPVQLLKKRNPIFSGYKKVKCLIQADFWNGDPDIDAICRIGHAPEVIFKNFYPFTSKLLTPFNSQNTFISGKILKDYFMLPHVGRMDDIWAAYYLQQKLKKKLPFVVFSKASVYQKRNEHNLVKDLNNEMIGYNYSINFNKISVLKLLPKKTIQFVKMYTKFINQI